MKFTIEKNIILNNLNHVSKGISNKNLIPILSGIKFELNKEGLLLTGTDNNITIQTFINKKDFKEISEEGSIVLQGKYIVEIIRKLPEEDISFELIDGMKVIVKTSSSEFKLNGMLSTEYPKITLVEHKDPLLLDQSILKEIVNQTCFATSNQESRPLLTGLNIIINDNKMKCIATDSYRLAQKNIELDKNHPEDINIVIPHKNIIELTKILQDINQKVELHIFNNKILFKFDNILYQSILLNGTYPDTSALIPNNETLYFNVNINNFYNIVDRASLLTSERDKNIIRLETKKNLVKITSNTPEIGRVEEKITVDKENPEDINISFSSKYMKEALKAFSETDVKISFNGESKPIILTSVENKDLIQLILPIKTY